LFENKLTNLVFVILTHFCKISSDLKNKKYDISIPIGNKALYKDATHTWIIASVYCSLL